jgi:dolichol-phosphate mannosyltransferase
MDPASEPPCAKHVFSPRLRDYCLIIPVLDEGEKFTRQLEALQPFRDQVDIIISDGGSRDGATDLALMQGRARALLINHGRVGLSVQYRQMLRFALDEDYIGLIAMDGNGKDSVDSIPDFLAALKQGVDLVQGSRFMPGGFHANTPPDRVWGIRLVFNPIMRLGSGFRYTDGINGYKGFSPRFLRDPRLDLFRDVFVNYNLQYYLNYQAPRLGYTVREIPVRRVYPMTGRNYSKIRGMTGRLGLLAALLATVTGRYNP